MKLKHTLVALTAFAAGSFSTIGHASGSATLYGLLDTAVVLGNVRNPEISGAAPAADQRNRWPVRMASPYQGSYVGLRGVEDLGGGLSALYRLEFDIETFRAQGTVPSRYRPRFVGLRSQDLGRIELGRQYDAMVDHVAPMTMAGTDGGALFAWAGDPENMNNTYTTNNAVKYTSPNLGGLTLSGMYGLSDNISAQGSNRTYSFGGSYENGPFRIGGAYTQIDRPQTGSGAWSGSVRLSQSAMSSPWIGMPGSRIARARIYGLGSSYALGPAVFSVALSHVERTQSSRLAKNVIHDKSNVEFNVRYQLTPAFSLAGAYMLASEKTSRYDKNIATRHQLGLKAGYALSKRTNVYVAGIMQLCDQCDRAQLNGLSPAAGNAQFALATGLLHRF
jgi:GBP family porin